VLLLLLLLLLLLSFSEPPSAALAKLAIHFGHFVLWMNLSPASSVVMAMRRGRPVAVPSTRHDVVLGVAFRGTDGLHVHVVLVMLVLVLVLVLVLMLVLMLVLVRVLWVSWGR